MRTTQEVWGFIRRFVWLIKKRVKIKTIYGYEEVDEVGDGMDNSKSSQTVLQTEQVERGRGSRDFNSPRHGSHLLNSSQFLWKTMNIQHKINK